MLLIPVGGASSLPPARAWRKPLQKPPVSLCGRPCIVGGRGPKMRKAFPPEESSIKFGVAGGTGWRQALPFAMCIDPMHAGAHP